MEQNEKVTPITALPNAENSVPEKSSGRGRQITAIQPFQFKKGVSGNPGGRPKKPPITYRIAGALEMCVPKHLRLSVEKDLNEGATKDDEYVTLDKNFTFGDLGAILAVYAMTGRAPRFKLEVLEWLRLLTEGPINLQINPLETDGSQDDEILTRAVTAKLVNGIFARARAFNMELPVISEIAAEVGVVIDVASSETKETA